jgi:hypothetical protein
MAKRKSTKGQTTIYKTYLLKSVEAVGAFDMVEDCIKDVNILLFD